MFQKKLIPLLIILLLVSNLIACSSKSVSAIDTSKKTPQVLDTKTKADQIRFALISATLYYDFFDTLKEKLNFKENGSENPDYYEQLWKSYKTSDFGKNQLQEISTTFLFHKDYNEQFNNLLDKWDISSKDTNNYNVKSNKNLEHIIKQMEKEKYAQTLYGEKIDNKILLINKREENFKNAMIQFSFGSELINELNINDLKTMDDEILIQNYDSNITFLMRDMFESIQNILNVYEIFAENPIESYYISSLNNAIKNNPELNSLENCIDIPNKYESTINTAKNVKDAIDYLEKLKTALKILK